MSRTRWLKYAVFIYLFTFMALTLNISNNLFSLYSVHSGFCTADVMEPKQGSDGLANSTVPRHIHQMFFNITDKTIPPHLEKSRRTWTTFHHAYKYTLWNETMLLDLIRSKYPELLPLYNSYAHWVKRADVGRYVILHEYGGIYVDLDIGAKLNIQPLLNNINKESTGVVLYFTKPVGVSNDFMIAKARHPFIKHVICGLEAGNRWYVLPYVTTLMTTGPGYLYGKYKTYGQRSEISIIDESVLNPFLSHKEGGAWHGVDGKAIWWIYIHRKFLVKTIFILMSVIAIVVFFRNIYPTLRKLYLRNKRR